MNIKTLIIAGIIVSGLSVKGMDIPVRDSKEALAALKAELVNLWDWSMVSKEPLDTEIVYSTVKDGYKIEGVYINGTGGADGKDRIFFYYAYPEKPDGKVPVVINLTGSSGDDAACLWIAKSINGACVDIEWRSRASKWRSKWVGGEAPKYRGIGPLKADQAYRVISGARRLIDFLCEQDYVDQKKLAAMGGSMGGIYTMLLSGVDTRICGGVTEVGVGHLADSDCAQGALGFDVLSPERKQIWLQAFDPYSHAKSIQAKILSVSCSDDHFCALGDMIETYLEIPSEKRICIQANYDHSQPNFGAQRTFQAFAKWLPYCFGNVSSYLKIDEKLENEGNNYWINPGREEVSEALLYWSPGDTNIVWQARYWVEIKAEQKNGRLQAAIPDRFAALPGFVFMNVYNSKGEMASTIPLFRKGTITEKFPLWDNEQLWDVKSGVAAWRPVVAQSPAVPRTANIQLVPPYGLAIGPTMKNSNQTVLPGLANPTAPAVPRFVIVTSSIGLVSGEAETRNGLCFEINGNGAAGELKLTLTRNFDSYFSEANFEYTLRYGKDSQKYSVPWSEFKTASAPDAKLFPSKVFTAPDAKRFPFDTLQIEGTREDSSQITIKSIVFL